MWLRLWRYSNAYIMYACKTWEIMLVSWYAFRANTTDSGRSRTEDVSEMMLYCRLVRVCGIELQVLPLTVIGPIVRE